MTTWYVASRGRDRQQDYTWVASADNPVAAQARTALELATMEHLTGGGEPNVFLRRTDQMWVVALWQLRHPGWPADAESRPIMAHVIGAGAPGGEEPLLALARGALAGPPPRDLLHFRAASPGFTVDFAQLDLWLSDCAADRRLPSPAELARSHAGSYYPGQREGFVLEVPRREVTTRPKARPAAVSRAFLLSFAIAFLLLFATWLLALVD